MGFVGNVFVPKGIDSGQPQNTTEALLIDVVLLGLFAIQHSGMARHGFKRVWTKFVGWPIERTTYVLLATCVLALLMWQWRPIPRVIWNITDPVGIAVLRTLYFCGWTLLLLSTFLINHFELFGLQQVYYYLRGQKVELPAFKTPALYRLMRHPIYFSFLVAFWAAPTMTAGHLLFSVATTGYILLAIQFEERDLIRLYGEAYRRYRETVPMLLPISLRRKTPADTKADSARTA
jgi:protein-S-isoprenylcysteine O-methyltransferase Ste14